MADKIKICPFCGKTNLEIAIICKYCKSELINRKNTEKAQSKKNRKTSKYFC